MQAIFTLIGLIALGLGVAWLARRLLGGLTEASFLLLLAAPLITYGIATGVVTEFSGLGIAAKFSKAAETKVTEIAGKLAIPKRIENTDFKRSSLLQACVNFFVITDTFIANNNDKGTTQQQDNSSFFRFSYEVASAIRGALLCPDFYGVVVLDKYDHFLGLFPPERFASLLAYPLDPYCKFGYKCDKQPDMSAVLAETELGVILTDPEVRVKTPEATKYIVFESDSLVEIVQRPEFSQASVFAVLDRNAKFIGLLPKHVIYDKIFSIILSPRSSRS